MTLTLQLRLASRTTKEGARNAGQVWLRQTAPDAQPGDVEVTVSYPDMQDVQRTLTVKPGEKRIDPAAVSKSMNNALTAQPQVDV